MPLVRVTPENAAGDETARAWRAAAWRNERVNAQFTLWSRAAIPQLRLSATALRSDTGAEIPATALNARFVRYVWASVDNRYGRIPGEAVGDILDTAAELDLPAGGFRPVWLTVTVPADAAPGHYHGTLTATGQGGRAVGFPLSLEVLPATLPDPGNWTFFLDLWQHPWAAARYHGVTPFSPEHYALLEPLYRELASAGQKVITTTITERPWNQQTYDAYHSMITRARNPDDTWTFDYTLFDHYVAFAQHCGLGPQIHCYTMAPWGNLVQYTDAATGDTITATLKAGTPEYEAYWAPFLADFQRHLLKKGWAARTHIALDERSPEELRATIATLKKHAPLLKIAMANNKAPSAFKGISMDNYSQALQRIDDGFLAEIAPRQASGAITTFYVCVTPPRPNTFTTSPCAEQVWLGYYAAAHRLDGILRWSYAHWPREPLWDSSFRPENWGAGDTFLVYPGPRSSVRWELFRDGIEEAEKIRLLRAAPDNSALAALEKTLSEFTYKKGSTQSAADLADLVDRARAAVETATRASP
ncbi:MAG: DUF4091 domain-containing protein [Opitutaceae bacterium]|nr:DUF4091 domain-containing protein [Opitutaceae bacterium]